MGINSLKNQDNKMKPILMFEQFLQEADAAGTSGQGGMNPPATAVARPSNSSAPQTATKGPGPKSSSTPKKPGETVVTPLATTAQGLATAGLVGSYGADQVTFPSGPTMTDEEITKFKDMLVDILDAYVTIPAMQTILKIVKGLKDKRVASKYYKGREVSALGRLCLMYTDDERGDLLANDIKKVGEATWNVGEGGKEAKAEALAILAAPAQGLKSQVSLAAANTDQLKKEFFI